MFSTPLDANNTASKPTSHNPDVSHICVADAPDELIQLSRVDGCTFLFLPLECLQVLIKETHKRK